MYAGGEQRLVSPRAAVATVRPCCVGGEEGAAVVAVASGAIAQCLSACLVCMYEVLDSIFNMF